MYEVGKFMTEVTMLNTIIGIPGKQVLVGSLFENNLIIAAPGKVFAVGGFLNDIIIGSKGNNTLYGDTPDVTTAVTIPNDFTIVTPPQFIVFGNDIIYGGTGNNFISGDQGNVVLNITFSTEMASSGHAANSYFELTGLTQIWGSNTIYGGKGTNIIWGNVVDATIVGVTNGSTAIADGAGSNAIAEAVIDNNFFQFGNNLIYGGVGKNEIIGNSTAIDQEPGGGMATATNGGHAQSIFLHSQEVTIMGTNIIYGGVGTNEIYGTADFNTHDIHGGVATADGSGSVASTYESITQTSLIMGNNTLYGGLGTNVIFGNVEEYYNFIYGGSATATNGGHASSTMIVDGTLLQYGDNFIQGGIGHNTLYGNAEESIIGIKDPGTVFHDATSTANVTTQIINFSMVFGNDHIIGGNNSVNNIIGDALEYGLLDPIYASKVVNGHLVISDSANNSINWGNDIFSSGLGAHDNFIFTLFQTTNGHVGTQGFDEITNFNITKDTLEFGNLIDRNGDHIVKMADLNTSTSLSYAGDATIINFDGGGAITLDHLHITSLNQLHITVSQNVIPVV